MLLRASKKLPAFPEARKTQFPLLAALLPSRFKLIPRVLASFTNRAFDLSALRTGCLWGRLSFSSCVFPRLPRLDHLFAPSQAPQAQTRMPPPGLA